MGGINENEKGCAGSYNTNYPADTVGSIFHQVQSKNQNSETRSRHGTDARIIFEKIRNLKLSVSDIQ